MKKKRSGRNEEWSAWEIMIMLHVPFDILGETHITI